MGEGSLKEIQDFILATGWGRGLCLFFLDFQRVPLMESGEGRWSLIKRSSFLS